MARARKKRTILDPTRARHTQQQHQNDPGKVTTKRVPTRTAATTGRCLQRVRAENTTGTSAIPPRLRRFPDQADVAPCSQKQAVRVLARPDSQSSIKTLPQIQRPTQGTRPEDQEWPKVDEAHAGMGR